MASPYDSDPEALAWARGKVEEVIAACHQRAAEAHERGSVGSENMARAYRQAALVMSLQLIGASYTIGAFDERRLELDSLSPWWVRDEAQLG